MAAIPIARTFLVTDVGAIVDDEDDDDEDDEDDDDEDDEDDDDDDASLSAAGAALLHAANLGSAISRASAAWACLSWSRRGPSC